MRWKYIAFISVVMLSLGKSKNVHGQRLHKGETVQGFIINIKKDTIHGMIEVEDYELAEIRVKFQERKGKDLLKSKTYKPKDLTGYAIKVKVNNNSKQIQETWISYLSKDVLEPPRPFASTSVFIEQREAGMLNLYSYYIRSNSSANLIQYFILEHANSKQLIKVTAENFDEITNKYLKGCAILRNRFGRADVSYLNLPSIIYIYNRCKSEATPHSN